MKNKKLKGFTLIEILIVMTIIAILAMAVISVTSPPGNSVIDGNAPTSIECPQ